MMQVALSVRYCSVRTGAGTLHASFPLKPSAPCQNPLCCLCSACLCILPKPLYVVHRIARFPETINSPGFRMKFHLSYAFFIENW